MSNGKKEAEMLFWIVVTLFMFTLPRCWEKQVFFCEKENEGLGKLCSALFLLFTLFYDLFGSFRHANNLKATIGSDLYLKFAKG